MPGRVPFRFRAHEVSRLEAFSDVIFGFAVSLIVVSLEAPKSYAELMEMMRGFLPFAGCFFIFIDIWLEHHAFFRRYALQDNVIITLNTALLFVILFYVYPLKYMFVMMVNSVTGREAFQTTRDQASMLFTIYGLGFTAVFWLLAALYAYALRQRDELGLNAVELIDTQESFYDNLAMGCFGIISILLAHSSRVGMAGMVYFLIAVPKTVIPTVMGRRRRKAEEEMRGAPAA